MMKMTALSSIVLLMLAAPAMPWAQPEPLERFAPANTVYLYVSDMSNTPDLAERFPNYGEAQAAWSESLNDIFEVWMVRSVLEKKWAEYSGGQAWDDVWGDRMMVAATTFGDTFASVPSLMLVFETRNGDVAREFSRSLLTEAAGMIDYIETDEEFYRDFVINSLNGPGRIPGLGLAVIQHENHLFVSTNKPLLLDILENAEYREGSLLDNPAYQDARSELDGDYYSFQFTNLSEIMKTVNMVMSSIEEGSELLPGGTEEMDEDILQMFAAAEDISRQFSSIRYHASGRWVDEDNTERSTGVVGLDAEALDEPFRSMIDRAPSDQPGAGYLVRETGSYMAGNVLGLNDIWSLIEAIASLHPEARAAMDEAMAALNEFGVDPEDDVLGWMGDEWAMIRPVMKLDAIVPVNQTALMVRVTDTEACLAAMETIETIVVNMLTEASIPVTLETEEHRDATTIRTFLPTIPLVPLSPSWFIHENNLFITSDIELARSMLDAKVRGRGGIDRNRYYRDASAIMDQPASMVHFVDIEADLFAQRDALQRVSSFANTLGEKVEMMALIVMDRISRYMLISQIYKASAQNTLVASDSIRTEQRVQMSDLRAVPSDRNVLRYKVSLGLEPLSIYLAEESIRAGDRAGLERGAFLYEILHEHNPTNPVYLDALSRLYPQLDQKDKLEAIYANALLTMPDTPIVIAREVAMQRETSSDIINAVRDVARTTARVNEQAALFGTALRLRDQNVPARDIATQLFSEVAESESDLAPLAATELQMLSQNPPQAPLLHTVSVDQLPFIDGMADDAAWSLADAHAKSLAPDAPIEVRSVYNTNGIAFLLTSTDDMTMPDDIEESVHVLFDPTRTWTGFHEFTSAHSLKAGDRSVESSYLSRVIDPYNLVPEESINQQPPKDMMSAVFETLSMLPLEELGIDPGLETEMENLVREEENRFSIEYAAPGDPWAIEIYVPFEELAISSMEANSAFHLQYVREGYNGFTANLSSGFDENDPATYGILLRVNLQ